MRWRTLFQRAALDRATEGEMQAHLEFEIEAGMRRGLSRPEAEREARLRLGSVAAALEEVRDHRHFAWLAGAMLDLRQAWVALRRKPSYVAVAGGTLAAAVAVNTLVFTILYGVLLRPLPYPEPERLVRLFEDSAANPKWPLSIYHYQQNKRLANLLDGQALYTRGNMQLMHEERAEPITAVAVTEQFLPLLGGSPEQGRNFREDEMQRSARVIILSHTFWATRLRGDAGVIGKRLRLDREDWTVIGIAPSGFEHIGGTFRSPLQGDTVAIWRPLPEDLNPQLNRGAHYTNAIARLKPGVSMDTARQELSNILKGLASEYPDNYSGRTVAVERLDKEVAGKSRSTVLLISGAGAMVLLLATMNVAGLSIARALARRRELAVRAALGGGKWQLLRAILAENLTLGALAAAVGLAGAFAFLPSLRAMLPTDFPRLHEIVFRWPSALFAVAAALVTSVAAGCFTSLRHTRADPAETLHEDSRSATGSRPAVRLRGALVAAQVALACLLMFGSALLLRSSYMLAHRDHGFDASRTLTFGLALPERVYNPDRTTAFYAEAGRKLREIPGVQFAGFGTSLPWTGYDENTFIEIPEYVPRAGESVQARYQSATVGFVESLGMRLIRGRSITEADGRAAPKVVIVNEAFVRRYFPDRDPIGRTANIWGASQEIVGVVADIRDWPADGQARPAFWFSMEQSPFARVVVSVRAAADPSQVLPAVRAAIASIDPELPLFDVRYLTAITDAALAERRFTLWATETFALLAIGLAALGIYALLAYSVGQRRREIGVRLALGATRTRILGTILSRGLVLAAVGIGAGLVLAPIAGQAIEALLFGVRASDLAAILLAPTIVLIIAAIACLGPALSAVRTEPMSALRDQ